MHMITEALEHALFLFKVNWENGAKQLNKCMFPVFNDDSETLKSSGP